MATQASYGEIDMWPKQVRQVKLTAVTSGEPIDVLHGAATAWKLDEIRVRMVTKPDSPCAWSWTWNQAGDTTTTAQIRIDAADAGDLTGAEFLVDCITNGSKGGGLTAS